MRHVVQSNDIGLSEFASAELGGGQRGLLDQLTVGDIPHTVVAIRHLVGVDGNAYTVSYIRPATGIARTTMVVPGNVGGDGPYEDWYIFDGMSIAANLAKGETWWLEQVYDRRREWQS